MPARRHAWLLQLLQTQRALARLPSPNPPQALLVRQVIPIRLRRQHRRVRHARQTPRVDIRVRVRMLGISGVLHQQRVVGAVRVRVKANLDAVVQDRGAADHGFCIRYAARPSGSRVLQVQPRLHRELQDEQHAEDFVADALLGGLDAAGEEVAQAEEALGEVVVGAGEVEDAEGEGVQGRGGGDGVDVGEDVGLDGVQGGLRWWFLARVVA